MRWLWNFPSSARSHIAGHWNRSDNVLLILLCFFFFTQGWEYWHPAHIGRKVFQCNRTRAICVILSATTPSSCTVKFRFQHRIPSHCVAFCYGWCRFTVVNSLGMSQCGVRNTKLVVNVRLSSVICWKWNWIKTQNADNFEDIREQFRSAALWIDIISETHTSDRVSVFCWRCWLTNPLHLSVIDAYDGWREKKRIKTTRADWKTFTLSTHNSFMYKKVRYTLALA